MAFSPDGQSLLTASRDGTVQNLERSGRNGKGRSQGAQRRSEQRPIQSQRSLCRDGIIPGSHGPALGRADRGAQIAVLASPEEENKRPTPTRAAFSSDGTRIVIVSGDERRPRNSRFSDTPRSHRFREANCSTRTDRVRTATLLPSRRRRRWRLSKLIVQTPMVGDVNCAP